MSTLIDKTTKMYLAGPYSHESSAVRAWRYWQLTGIAADFALNGYKVFSPITHSHPMELNLLERGYSTTRNKPEIWLELDRPFMEDADVLVVVMLAGWKESEGVGLEIDMFVDAGKPIYFYDPEACTVSEWLRFING